MSTLAPGVRIGGRYLLERRLGLGGMGEVWLAEQHGAGAFRRRVVLKVLAPARRGDARLAAMLADEARLVGLLHHPGIVSALDYLETPEYGPVFVLEYVDGASLRTALRLARKQHLLLPEALAAHIGIQVAHALHAAHTAEGPDRVPLHVIHRDVSSDNVLLSRSGGVWIGDFGVARSATAADLCGESSPTGKRGYMPPEQLAGEPLGPTADVFALGRVVSEAADLGCGRALRKVIQKATADRPRDRFQTAAELAEAFAHACPPPPQPKVALGRWLEQAVPPAPSQTPSAPPPPRSAPPPAGRPLREELARPRETAPLFAAVPPPRRRWGLRIAAALLVVLVLVVPFGLFYGARHGGTRHLITVFAAGLSSPHGELRVSSRPEAAEVYVDGELKGTTPLLVELPPGPHAVRVGSTKLERWHAEQVQVKARTLHRLEIDLRR